MFSSFTNMMSMVRKAQEMGGRMQGSNEQLKRERVTGSAGGGLVTVELNGVGEMLSLKIDPLLLERGELEMIEDLLPAAVNQAREKASLLHAEAMQEMSADMNMPGMADILEKLGGMVPAESIDAVKDDLEPENKED